ncbi:hypothetical protein Glove_5g73 [Diversispora epigaea]|uniref:BTB domain-containing protein n=1 Tax=Diversispora epigaea TaxID=1348612 RepID=A0A397JR69_9GLOM|nr:hypothetical protein Glove_5g73 [Diversispora epigaea]
MLPNGLLNSNVQMFEEVDTASLKFFDELSQNLIELLNDKDDYNSLKFFDELSQNLIELLNDKDDYNVIIEVENKEESFTIHSNILKFRSRRELENILSNEKNIKMIIKSRISAQIFNAILHHQNDINIISFWGIAQSSILPTNLDKWTENLFTQETTLQQCLLHIRYFHLSGIEVLDKIEPYIKILDK